MTVKTVKLSLNAGYDLRQVFYLASPLSLDSIHTMFYIFFKRPVSATNYSNIKEEKLDQLGRKFTF